MLETLTEQTAKLPNGARIVESGYVLAGIGRHRDSDVLDTSNFDVALELFRDATGEDIGDLGQPWDDPEWYGDSPPVAIAHFRHWAVGWVDEIVVRVDDATAMGEAEEIRARLADYPVLDEEAFSLAEWEENHPDDDDVCYSDDPDCGCGRGE